jgi:hypothetical protein
MTRAGRPAKNGVQEGWMLLRAAWVLEAYDSARKNGLKHSDGITEAVNSVHQKHPKMPISESAVKRILASHRPKHSRNVLIIEKEGIQPGIDLTGGVAPPKPLMKYAMKLDDRPVYPRCNAKPPKPEKQN